MLIAEQSKGERLVFLVRSENQIKKWYRVDLEADGFRGECECQNFSCRVRPERKRTGKWLNCKHVESAIYHLGLSVLRQIKAQRIEATGSSASDVGPA